MENYDEKMNYSFEPAPEEPSRPPLEQAKEEIRHSGKHTGLKIAALLAALAIVHHHRQRSVSGRCHRGDQSAELPRRES